MSDIARRSLALCGLLAVLPAGAVRATVDFCDVVAFPECVVDLGSCILDLDYGNSGLVRSLAFIHVDGIGTLSTLQFPPQTGLGLTCEVTGLGSSTALVELTIDNPTGLLSPVLTYFAFVNPDGNADPSSPNTMLKDVPGVTAPMTIPPGDPLAFGIDDRDNLDSSMSGNIEHEMFVLAALSDTDFCAPVCDQVAALEFGFGIIPPGGSASVIVALSDGGTAISQTFITAARADDFGVPDDPGTVLTFSGLPEPGSSLQLLVGISSLAALHRLRRRGSRRSTG